MLVSSLWGFTDTNKNTNKSRGYQQIAAHRREQAESTNARSLAFSERPRTIANDKVVPLAGLEPARCFHHLILSQARLPIPPQGLDPRDHSGEAQGVNGPIPLPLSHRYYGSQVDGDNVDPEQATA
jgi:hypothetical protein